MEIAPKLNPPLRTLLGPGPSPVNPRVLESLSLPVIGHLDPAFLKIMDESIPEGTDDARCGSAYTTNLILKIGAGLGPLKGKVWRVGLMGTVPGWKMSSCWLKRCSLSDTFRSYELRISVQGGESKTLNFERGTLN